ncbi:FtsK/SpoIIIE domain-containing protein [Streptomyces albireticuli]|uniref:Cell division protein FtsK n=1 Tax=Streptomyces albireticuli TaxID=1940 RepID=A0A2A2D2R5_9ACTN|nr:FtsK/SpoIIIE domain-containing protein [Streptomyces albireticuli]MCD9144761.1 cell division protein FtsK [Streptomyces albireticuli]MCD9165509.1 cell division protein FtsK [Streptomyces albireticuli]MCD9193668.1 cell division protein FtsK [Streptomyces albireticuli]PAU45801.1 cell division protein FtsK [Streptomyces albireticuli]
MVPIAFAFLLALLAWVLVAGAYLRDRYPVVFWYLTGYPVTALRVVRTWRKVAQLNDLAVSPRPARGLLGNLVVKGDSLQAIAPRISFPRATRTGLSVVVRLHPGQTPAPFIQAADALAHAWRVHAVRVTSPERGRAFLLATAADPLRRPGLAHAPAVLLSALVGILESGGAWVMNLRQVPHWLIVGATQSGKSTLMARLIVQLAPQPVALIGIDCKGGMELGLFESRLSGLATSRREAVAVLGSLVEEMALRMEICRMEGVRSIWDLPDKTRPVPVVVLVDELAELYLTDGTRDGKAEAEKCSTLLLRIAQLGATLGLHLVLAGQRVGSDLGPGATALRAQLSGRICHRVNDPGTAEMVLGDLNKDAVTVAQSITTAEQGVAVCTSSQGGWGRARSHLTTIDDARKAAGSHAHLTPELLRVRRALLLAGTAGGEGA